MKYYRFIFPIVILLVSTLFAPSVFGAPEAGQSAQLLSVTDSAMSPADEDMYKLKKQIIEAVLTKYNSPLAGSADAFVKTCVKYSLNCYLLPSIAGLESTFGKFILPGSNNPFGWGRGYILFDDWSEGIDTVGRGLRRNYLNKGAANIEHVAKIYSESPTWSPRVMYFIREFERAELEQKQLQMNIDAVQL